MSKGWQARGGSPGDVTWNGHSGQFVLTADSKCELKSCFPELMRSGSGDCCTEDGRWLLSVSGVRVESCGVGGVKG